MRARILVGGDACRLAVRARRRAELRLAWARAPPSPLRAGAAVASMPQHLYGAAAASNGTYAYAAGGIDARRHDPGHLLPLQPGQRAVGHVSAADARLRWQWPRPSITRPTNSDLRLRWRESGHRRFQQRHAGLRPHERTRGPLPRTCRPRAHPMAADFDSANGRIYLVGGSDAVGLRRAHRRRRG